MSAVLGRWEIVNRIRVGSKVALALPCKLTLVARSSFHMSALSKKWLLRDWIQLQVAIAVLLCTLLVCLYWFNGWSPVWQPLHRPPPGHPLNNQNIAARFVGSIIFVPLRGDKCLKRLLDNRTGAMWDVGYFKCEILLPPPPKSPHGMGMQRIRAIGKALR